jgi:hypothetical protein
VQRNQAKQIHIMVILLDETKRDAVPFLQRRDLGVLPG